MLRLAALALTVQLSFATPAVHTVHSNLWVRFWHGHVAAGLLATRLNALATMPPFWGIHAWAVGANLVNVTESGSNGAATLRLFYDAAKHIPNTPPFDVVYISK